MPLDINGYNETFSSFVQFAQRNVNANDEKAVANAQLQRGPLGGRKIVAVTNAFTDSVHKFTRNTSQFVANERTRALFKKAIADMFGGESKIPASVKKAMQLSDYGSGKPLTARRIMAVKAAIDTDGSAAVRSARLSLETFSPEVKTAALALGYTKGELPKLARAAHFLSEATGKSEMEAMKEVAEPGSKANRLMNYGGRFMTNAENFEKGLRLLDLFATWYDDLTASLGVIAKTAAFASNRDYSTADTPTKLNADTNIVTQKTRHTMEKFIFEALGANREAKLGGTDAEALFGMKNNDASRFIAQDFGHACLNTVANIPPAKRAVVFKVFNLFCSMVENPADHRRPGRERYLLENARVVMLARVLRNLDAVLALEAEGKLTAKNVIKTCFPDMVAAKATGNWDRKAVMDFLGAVGDEIDAMPDEGGKYFDISGPLHILMQTTGCTLQEGAESLRGGKPLPLPPYVSAGQLPIEGLETIEGARHELEGDIDRPDNYSFGKNAPGLLKTNPEFGFKFPGEDRFSTNGTEAGRANIPQVGDKVEALCGRVHKKQASAVMMMLSQSGSGPLRGGLRPYGVISSEHSALDYTLTKDAKTGAVTIKYSSPAELPFRFEWTATVDVDGKVTTTPLQFEKPLEMNVALAGKFVDDAAGAMGVKLTRAQRDYAMEFVAANGAGMYEKNARLLAQFTVNLRLSDASATGDRALVKDMADSIRHWRDFGFRESGMEQVNAALKAQTNVILAENLANALKFKAPNPDVYETMKVDANRLNFFVNGQQIVSGANDKGAPLIAALRQALPGKAIKTVSALLNQETARLVGYPQSRLVYPKGPGQEKDVDVHALPGARKLANRNFASGLYMQMLAEPDDVTYALDVAKDGKTATITTSYRSHLVMGAGTDSRNSFGDLTVQTRVTLDLAAEEPTIIDARFAQSFD